jgi:hypothetical protein
MSGLIVVVLLAHWLYSDECCGGDECRPVPCWEVNRVADGWNWRGIFFSTNVVKLSPDGNCHVCYGEKAFIGHCIYLPPET